MKILFKLFQKKQYPPELKILFRKVKGLNAVISESGNTAIIRESGNSAIIKF